MLDKMMEKQAKLKSIEQLKDLVEDLIGKKLKNPNISIEIEDSNIPEELEDESAMLPEDEKNVFSQMDSECELTDESEDILNEEEKDDDFMDKEFMNMIKKKMMEKHYR